MATKSISQLTTATDVDNNDLFEVAHPDVGSATGYTSNKQSLAAIADHIAREVNYPSLETNAKALVGAVNELKGVELTGTLAAGATSISFSDAAITTSSTIDLYTDVYGINPSAVVVTTGNIALTFEAQSVNVGVKVRVS